MTEPVRSSHRAGSILGKLRTLSHSRFLLLLAVIAFVWGFASETAFRIEFGFLKPDWANTRGEIPDYFIAERRRLYRKYHTPLALMAAAGAGAAAAVYFERRWKLSRESLVFLSWPALYVPIAGTVGCCALPCILFAAPLFIWLLILLVWRKRFWDLAPLLLNAVFMTVTYKYMCAWLELFD